MDPHREVTQVAIPEVHKVDTMTGIKGVTRVLTLVIIQEELMADIQALKPEGIPTTLVTPVGEPVTNRLVTQAVTRTSFIVVTWVATQATLRVIIKETTRDNCLVVNSEVI